MRSSSNCACFSALGCALLLKSELCRVLGNILLPPLRERSTAASHQCMLPGQHDGFEGFVGSVGVDAQARDLGLVV